MAFYEDDDYDDAVDEETASSITIDFPESIGECIDKLYQLRSFRIKQEHEIKERKKTETAYRKHIIELLEASKLEGGKGNISTASIKKSEEPTPANWDAIYTYIEENEAFDLLQRRLSSKAIKQRWELGEEIPGVEKFTVVDLSLTKRS